MVSKKVIVLFSMAAVVFNNWLLGTMLNRRLFKAVGSVSEFSASTQPHHMLFRSLDVIAGLLIVVCSGWLFRRAPYKLAKTVAGGLGVLGLGNILDAFFAMPCSDTVDSACRLPVRIHPSNFYLPPHTYSSTLLGILFLGLPLLGILLALRTKHLVFGVLSFITAAMTLVFFSLLWQASGSGFYIANHAAGYSQYIQMLLFGAWLIGLVFVFDHLPASAKKEPDQ